MSTKKLMPWGCDQQGRYETRSNPRYDKWAQQDWVDTIVAPRKPPVPRKSEPPLTIGDLLMAAAIVGALGWIFSLGPWL